MLASLVYPLGFLRIKVEKLSREGLMRISILILLLVPHLLYAEATTKKQQIQSMDAKVGKQADEIRKLKLENAVLKKSLGMDEAKQAKKNKQVDDAVAFSEKAIFQKFSDSYERGQKADYKKALRLLSKNYPNSKYFPEIYYMTAQSSMAKGKHKTALKAYNAILKKYPKSEKIPAAVYGKALTYKELKLNKQALSLFHAIQKKYPNTPEAYNANLQAKLLNKKIK